MVILAFGPVGRGSLLAYVSCRRSLLLQGGRPLRFHRDPTYMVTHSVDRKKEAAFVRQLLRRRLDPPADPCKLHAFR
jgi:hypothetical protein